MIYHNGSTPLNDLSEGVHAPLSGLRFIARGLDPSMIHRKLSTPHYDLSHGGYDLSEGVWTPL